MKKTLLVTATTSAMLMAAASAHAMNAERAGQGFTDIMGDYSNASSNPALMTKYGKNDDFRMSLGVGVHAADQNEAIDAADDAQDTVEAFNKATEDLQAKIDNMTATTSDADSYEDLVKASVGDLRQDLTDISEEPLYLREGIDLSIAIPNKYLSTSMFVSQRGRLGMKADYSESDDAYLESLESLDLVSGDDLFDEDQLNSRVRAAGYSVADLGLSFGKSVDAEKIPFLTSLGLGANVKYQRLDIVSYETNVSSFDEDDITADEAHETDNGVNVDLGAVMAFDKEEKWTASISARDLIENSVKNSSGDEFTTDTRVTVGAGYQGDLFSLTAQSDVTEHGEFGELLKPVQYASIGAEFNLWDQAALRAGYRTDLNDVEEDIVTAGIGISPFNLVSLDVAAFAGSDNNVGGVVQIGTRF